MREYVSRYGRLRLVQEDGALVLEVADPLLLDQLWADQPIRAYLRKNWARHASRSINPVVASLNRP